MSQTSFPDGQYLGAGQTLRCDARPGAVLRVRSGRLWLTQSGDSNDHFLVAGDTFRVGSTRVVLEADTPQAARFEWLPPNASVLQRLRMAASRYMTWRAMSLTMSR